MEYKICGKRIKSILWVKANDKLFENNDSKKGIICLDEAISNMDPRTDKALHDALYGYSQNKYLLVITHLLENV